MNFLLHHEALELCIYIYLMFNVHRGNEMNQRKRKFLNETLCSWGIAVKYLKATHLQAKTETGLSHDYKRPLLLFMYSAVLVSTLSLHNVLA